MGEEVEVEDKIYGIRWLDGNERIQIGTDIFKLNELKMENFKSEKIEIETTDKRVCKTINKKKFLKYLMSIGYSRNEACGFIGVCIYRRMVLIRNCWYLFYIDKYRRSGLI